ncbi:MAG: tetratricopeptide repeat protein [bacterium]|nr:tetratricopeptide repeat protein [bacterium]
MSYRSVVGCRAGIVGCLALLLLSGGACRKSPPLGPPSTTPMAENGTPGRDGPEAISWLGRPLYRPALPADVSRDRTAKLDRVRADYEARPDDPEAAIWFGRRLAYLGRYREAVEVYGRAIEAHPDERRLYRHRGHRFVTLRSLDWAVRDLERAAQLAESSPDEVEPDGLPNARNQPTSTTHSNIWYHLGLAYYLRGDLDNALRCYRECLRYSKNPDMLCATTHWAYMTLRRMGRDDEASALLEPIHADMDIIENRAYHSLLLMYKGEFDAERLLDDARSADGIQSATTAYGIANWFSYNGERERAETLLREILAGTQWAAFGYIAAEKDLVRIENEGP